MDDLEIERHAAIEWLKNAQGETIKNHAEDWTPDEVADTVAEIADDLAAVAGWSDARTVVIYDCPMAGSGFAVRPGEIIKK